MNTDFVNPYYLSAFSTSETVKQAIVFEDYVVTDANTVTSAVRYKDGAASGTDISSVVTITGYTVTMANLWKVSNDTAAVGMYRVCIKANNPTATLEREINLFIPII